VLAATIGPIAILIGTNTLRFGLAAGVESAFGAALGDLTYAVVAALVGGSLTSALVAHRPQIHLAGCVVLVAYGAYAVVEALGARRAASSVEPAGNPKRLGRVQTTYALTVVNPLTIIVFAAYMAQLPAGLPAIRLTTVVASLFMGSLAVQLLIALGAASISSRVQDRRWIARLNLASGVGIMLFGVLGLF
jgi:threonine/homoserine/homoserine lactone efflux protein